MCAALTKLKKSGIVDDQGRKVKFLGRSTNESIKAFNVYYGGAIRNNPGDIDGMMRDIDKCHLVSFYLH